MYYTDDDPTFTLVDDGTLDTVLRCDKCGQEERFVLEDGEDLPEIDDDERIAVALEWAKQYHECEPEGTWG